LRETSFGEPILSWFKSFIRNRKHWVKIHGFTSVTFTTSSGDHQGGHFFPLLFSIFVNSANPILQHAKFLAFADDIKLCFRINSKVLFILKILYCAFVRQTLEYGSIIWDPHAASHLFLLEHMLSFKVNI